MHKKIHIPLQKYLPVMVTFFSLFIAIILFAGLVKGAKGNTPNTIYYQQENDTRVGGPFEGSNSTARYALTEAIITNKNLFLSRDLAEFASPDVVDYHGKFMSIFTPGISFLGVSFYLMGEFFKMPQLFTYFVTIVFAIINIFAVARIVMKFGAGYIAGIIGGFMFVFATNGLVYGLTFTQHHVSTSLVLFGVLIALDTCDWFNTILLGLLFGAGLLVDIPNAFFFAPILLYILWKNIHIQKIRTKVQTTIHPALFGFLIGVIPMLMIFGWYNHYTTGSYTKLSQNIGRSKAFRQGLPAHLTADGASVNQTPSFDFKLNLPFDSRSQLQGLYILMVSDERSWLYYSPVILLGILGFILLYRNEETRSKAVLILSIIIMNIVMYSMFSDPWGGWAFGSRYLIPAASLMCMFAAIALTRFKNNPFFILAFGVLLYYSIWVSTLGALTTAAIPPKVEAVSLPTHIPYTYKYNQQIIAKNISSSLVYNLYLTKKISVMTYWNIYVNLIFAVFILFYLLQYVPSEERKKMYE